MKTKNDRKYKLRVQRILDGALVVRCYLSGKKNKDLVASVISVSHSGIEIQTTSWRSIQPQLRYHAIHN